MKDIQITAFKSIRDTKTPYYISLEKSIKRIQSGVSKELINKIRNTDDKGERDLLKSCLPSICYGGVFSERNKTSLKEHSGLMITDFDKMPTKKDFDNVWKQLTNNPHCVFLFAPLEGLEKRNTQ